jgi:predicted RNA-binding protein YlxR (DUF448 family)/ribosomal protein L30E
VSAAAAMTRGAHRRADTERRCIVSGRVAPREALIRFVVAPSGEVVADLAGKLGGRGLWVAADADVLARADARVFARAARGPVNLAPGLVARVEAALVRRLSDYLGMARRSGALVVGFEKTRAALKSGEAALLIAARDGAADGRAKLRALIPDGAEMAALDAAEIGAAVGRDAAVHGAVTDPRMASVILREAARLDGIRGTAQKVRDEQLLDKMDPS